MNISICITVLNEEESIGALLDSLINQSKKPKEIVIVDGGSTDRTIQVIRHYQKNDKSVKLLIEKCSRARGRNLGVEIAKGDIIAMTDAGCIAKKDWLEKLIKPFTIGKVDVSAGFYKMTGGSNLQKAESVFLGVRPTKYNSDFLPSTRSIAFTKKMWKKAGGFPEDLKGTAEDTVFNYKLIKVGAKISRVKDAIVEWGMPTSIFNFQFSIYNYAKGDAESKIWFFPGTGLASHNIKALSVVFRYLAGLVLFFLFLSKPVLLLLLFILVILYLTWSFRKIYLQFRDWKVAIWGPVLQVVSDFAVMGGFI